VKKWGSNGHSPGSVSTAGVRELAAAAAREALDVDQVYAEHADFVWRSLCRLGASPADSEDLLQEVFVVVQRQRASFEGRSKLETWLFGICLRVIKHHRRRAYFRRERPAHTGPEAIDARTPEQAVEQQQAMQRLAHVLAELAPERRAAFVMFEIEQLSTRAIADVMGVPIGTIHSRLHLARRDFERAVARVERRDQQARTRTR
jgi:RNA polymerase sigma-70 factor, ECF subfamily